MARRIPQAFLDQEEAPTLADLTTVSVQHVRRDCQMGCVIRLVPPDSPYRFGYGRLYPFQERWREVELRERGAERLYQGLIATWFIR